MKKGRENRPGRRRAGCVAAAVCMLSLEQRVLLASPFIDPPAPPQVLLDTTYVPGAGQTHVVNAGGNLQQTIDNAQLGDTIIVQAGATFGGNISLPNKTTGSGWITIRSSALDGLPAPGTRVTPAHTTSMPKIVSASDVPAVGTANGAHHYRFIGIEFTVSASLAKHTSGILRLGSGSETSLAQFPNNLVFDRCYIHGNTTGNIQNGIRLNSASTALIDSYMENCQAVSAAGVGSFESHNIGGYNGPGPYKLVNNTFSGATIPVIFGGAATSIAGMIPSDMEIRNNHFTRPRSWRPGDASYDGSDWYVKNLFELKNGQRVLFDGNLLEHNWPQAGDTPDGSPQHGFAILLTVRNGGSQTTPVVQDITLTNNVIRKSNAGISIYGGEASGTRRIKIENNLFDEIGLNWGSNDRSGMLTQFQTVGDTIFNHNTIINDGDIMFANGSEVADLDFTNNISNHNSKRTINPNRGINAPGLGPGNASLDAKFVQYLVTKNVMANSTTFGGNYTGAAAGNFFIPGTSTSQGDFSAVGFADLANRNYRLAPSSAYNNAATDGTDVGADIDALEAAVGGAISLPIAGTSFHDTFYLKRNGDLLEIYNNATGTGTPIHRDRVVYYESLHFNTGEGDDRIIIDRSGGNPVPAGGIFVDGGAGISVGNDVLQVIGGGGEAIYKPSAIAAPRGVIELVEPAAATITFMGIESVDFSGFSDLKVLTPGTNDQLNLLSPEAGKNRVSGMSGGLGWLAVTASSTIPLTIDAATNDATNGSNDTIMVSAAPGSSLRFIGGAGNDSMTIGGGALMFDSDLAADTSSLALTINGGAAVTFAASQHLRSLSVGGAATMSAHGGRVLVTDALTVNGLLDLADNDLVVDYSSVSPVGIWTGNAYNGITGYIASGRIISSLASGQLKSLGVAEGREALGITGSQTYIFTGESVDSTAVLVKFTWGGDANLDGKLNIDDYGRIDGNIAQSGVVFGWFNGDFNLDGKINIDDYGIIDGNINQQDENL